MRISTGEGAASSTTAWGGPFLSSAKMAIGIPLRMLHVMYRAQGPADRRMRARNADPAGHQP